MAKTKPTTTQIKIVRTKGEWDLIKQTICPAHNGRELIALSIFIRRKVLKIKTQLTELPESFESVKGEMVSKRPRIDNEILKDIDWIATKLQISPSTVIDRLIITPLLQSQP